MSQTLKKKTTSVPKNVAVNIELPVKARVKLELRGYPVFSAERGDGGSYLSRIRTGIQCGMH